MRVVVLGRVGIIANGSAVNVGRPQTRAVLALLALNVGEPVDANGIVDALWGGAEPATARTQVQNAVSAVRRALATCGYPEAIESGRYGYQLALAPDTVDIAEFDRLTQTARESADDAEVAASALRRALGLWRGTPLADATGAFIHGARANLVERQLLALELLADTELGRQQGSSVIADLLPAVGEHPFRESLRWRLMVALDRSGRQAEALQSFRAYRRLLAEQEGLDPGATIAQVAADILRGTAPAAGPTPPPPVEPATVEPIRPAPTGPAQLPAPALPFVGRRGYLDELDIIAAGATRVVAVTGMAGVGKTALATEWAWRVRTGYPDGQLFVDLRGFTPGQTLTPVVALARLLRALGEPSERIPTDVDEAAAAYRSRLNGRRMLVILDNASGPDQVRPLLPGGRDTFTIVTSRDTLTGLVARDGARPIALEPLSRNESELLIRDVSAGYGAPVNPETAEAMAADCGQLPLALRLAAANLAERRPHAPLSWRELSAGPGLGAPQVEGDQLASVRGAFERSYASLPPSARELFRLFGLFAGVDITPELAAALAGRDVDEDLTSLQRLNLIHGTGPRYTMHDLVRQYASSLSKGDSEVTRFAATSRMYRWYADGLAAAEVLNPQMLRLPADEPDRPSGHAFSGRAEILAWLDAELPNLVAVVEHAAEHGPRRLAARLADGLRGYFWIRRYSAEWIDVASAGIRAAEDEDDQAGVAANRISLASAYRSLSRYEESAAEIEQALVASRRVAWLEAEATALSHLAVVLAETGQLGPARDNLVAALAANRRLGRRGSEAVVLGNLGSLRIRLGELAQARLDLTVALSLYREVGSPGGEGITLTNLGLAYFYLGEFDRAERNLTEALARHRHIGDRYGVALSLCTQAYLFSEMGRLPAAIEVATECLDLAREIGDRQAEADVLVTLGHIRLALGAYDQALEYYQQGGGIADTAQDEMPAVEAMIGAARAQLAVGAVDHSAGLATAALRRAEECSFGLLGAKAMTVLAAAHLAAERPDRARQVAAEALARHHAMGHRPGEARTRQLLAEIYRTTGDLASSASALALAGRQSAAIGLASFGPVAAAT
jgi:DNA-binding SARP family transcriptional activator/tetratricopeptide (TPR) repeat protein